MKQNLFYIHGYRSEPHSTKGTLFYRTLDCTPISYRLGRPEDLDISEALIRISNEIRGSKNVVLIGSSLGGYLAAATALNHPNIKHLILLNPAIIPPDFDITTISDMPQHILKNMKNKDLFTKTLPMPITILRGTHDAVVPEEWIIYFSKSQNVTIRVFDDDHSLTNTLDRLPDIIQDILTT